jgi:hypothetical protein
MQNSQTAEESGSLHHIRTCDLDELALAQPDKNRRYLQLAPGRLQADLYDLRLRDFQLFRERLDVGMRIEAAPQPNLVPFAVTSSSWGSVKFCREGPAARSAGAVIPRGQ